MRRTTCCRLRAVIVAALPLLLLPGCGSRLHPVEGKVTLEDGSPLTRGLVVFESAEGKGLTARGEVGADGRYRLSTSKPGDGVPPGRYRVLVSPLDLSDVPDEQKDLAFDTKYLKFETSGLECEVQAGPNDFPIRLSKPKKEEKEEKED